MNIDSARKLGYKKVYFTFDCIGDTILLISALRYINEKNHEKLLIATRYKELVENCGYLDVLDDFSEDTISNSNYRELLNSGLQPIFISATDFVNEEGKYRPVWGGGHILTNMCKKLGVSAKIEIIPRLFLSDLEKAKGRFFQESQIAIISSGNREYKAIPFELAQTIVDKLGGQYNFVQVGSLEDPILEGALDKRECGIRETASILHNSDLFVGGIGGLMHMARAVDCRGVIAFSSAEPLTWENYVCNINVEAPEPKCTMCGNNLKFPYSIKCSNEYSCIKGIRVQEIIDAINIQMNRRNVPLEKEVCEVQPNQATGMEDYIKRFGIIRGG